MCLRFATTKGNYPRCIKNAIFRLSQTEIEFFIILIIKNISILIIAFLSLTLGEGHSTILRKNFPQLHLITINE